MGWSLGPENQQLLFLLVQCCGGVQSLSCIRLFPTPWAAAHEGSPSFAISWLLSHSVMSDSLWRHGLQPTRLPCPHQLPKLAQTHVHWVGDAIQPSDPLSSPSPTFNLSQHQGLFQSVSSSHQVAKVLEFQLQHQFFQWIFQTDILRMDWLDLLAVQGTLKSLLQHHSSKVSILRCSAFFMVQLSQPYMTAGKP